MKPISKATISETTIQRAILDYLSYTGWLVWREQSIPVPIRRGRAIVGLRKADPHKVGMPDIFAIKNGIILAVEVKSATGKPSSDQIRWRDKLMANGAHHLFARSVDEVIAYIVVNSL